MLPSQLSARGFARYPQRGRDVATANIDLIREMPLPLAASILRELSRFDWLFPAEQREVTKQFSVLASFDEKKRTEVLAGFSALQVQPSLAEMDWVNEPQRFLEALTAFLWSSHQIEAFHNAATHYAESVRLGTEDAEMPVPRACLVVFSRELEKTGYPLFRKLRPHGVWFENVSGELTSRNLQDWLVSRGTKYPAALTHFYVDGAEPLAIDSEHLDTNLDSISWTGVAPLRQAVLQRMHRIINTPGAGPELARTELAGLTPADLGIKGTGKNPVMDYFAVSVLGEGSGTQIFSTTFAQWTARELLRRAQPATLLVRFGPRRQLQPMNEMLAGTAPAVAPDLPGSLVDADMGAYYTWINQQRLPGAAAAVFVAYCEARRQALAVGPGLPRGTTASDPFSIAKLIGLLG